MKWLPFAILAVIGIVCQTTIVARIRPWGIGPDLMFVLAVYYALWGPWPEAAIAAWILGLIVDLFTAAPGGRVTLHAFCFGAAAWGIIQVRQVVVRNHPAVQFIITLLFGLGVQVVVLLYHRWSAPESGLAWRGALLSVVYTAAVAVPLLWALARLARLTGLKVESRPWR